MASSTPTPTPTRASTSLLILESDPAPAALNMALDETLLATAADRGQTVLRFYAWTEPAATFGYFQHLAEIRQTTALRPLIRRPTGGGLVPHDRDWTYSLAVPPAHPWHQLRAIDSYRAMHAWVVDAFRRIGIPTTLADCCRKVAPGQCFQGWEKFDVLWHDRKIGGAAQRRNRSGLLIQGSIQPPPKAGRATWIQAMRDAASDAGFSATTGMPADADLNSAASMLAESRYSRDEYNGLR
jgi:lipoate-protein ligase A